MNGVVVAGTRSGVGKTVATAAIIRALEAAGRTVQPAKAGPDFIDPSHHAAVAGRPSRTLDCHLQGQDGLRRNYHRGNGDVCVIEGVMGLYDGDASSTAMVAEALDLPVVLVVDGSAGMESVAATAHGFRSFASRIGRDVDVAGIVAQRTHGGRHADGIRETLPGQLTFLGRIPPDDRLEIPDRHLGLHSGAEAPLPTAALDEAAETIDAEGVLSLARDPPAAASERPAALDGQPTVAVARDDAFRFIYPATLERLRAAGEVTIVSPVAGDDLPHADAIYLPGGYPELHAATLANSPTLDAIADAAAENVPVLGECGGFMALAQSLETVDGDRYSMAGVLPADIQMRDRYQALDHVDLTARRDTPIAAQHVSIRAHEFHYSRASVDDDARFGFDVTRGDGIDADRDGLIEYRTVGTYAHFHAESGAFDGLGRAAD